jgi:hypothetical protein
MREVIDFAWEVTKGGYTWIQAEASPLRDVEEDVEETEFLTDGVSLGGRWERKRYTPLQTYTGLFLTFAATSPTKDGIQAFASEYGPLGGDVSIPIVLPTKQEGRGETLAAWYSEMVDMYQTVTLWKMVKGNDLRNLKKYIQWSGSEAVGYDSHPDLPRDQPPPAGEIHVRAGIATQHEPDLLARFRPGDLVQPALHYIQSVVNRHLQGRVSPRLLWKRESTWPVLSFVPGSLIGALWLQFAQTINGKTDHRECAQCRRWFEVSPTVARKSRLFCSNACRSRAYRHRQEEARRLHTCGLSLKEIARQLGTNTATAKGWIKRKEV